MTAAEDAPAPSSSGRASGDWTSAVERFVYANPLYRLSLSTFVRSPTFSALPRAFAGDPACGSRIAADGLVALGARARFGPDAWASAPDAAHDFDFLADLAASGRSTAVAAARRLIADWLEAHPGWTATAWAPGRIGRRLRNWIAYTPLDAPDASGRADDDASAAGTTVIADRGLSMLRQARHVARTPGPAATRIDALDAAAGLAVAACACAALRGHADRGFERLARCAEAQIAPDGGHRSRRPHAALRALQGLCDATNAARALGEAPPPAIRNAIDRLVPQLQAWRHGDGGFGLLAGGDAGSAATIDAAVAAADHTGRPQREAPYIGFHRLDAGRAALMFDVGVAPPDWDAAAHAAILAIEFSAGATRLVVSCGAPEHAPAAWRAAARGSAAHSGLTIEDVNVAEVLPAGGLGRRPSVTVERGEDGDGHWMTAAHDGYAARFGVLHQRALRLSRDGLSLTGRDRLVGAGAARFAIRFHLHPDVRANLSGGGAAVVLRTASGEGWRFGVDGAALALEPGVYWGDGAARRAPQIVLTGRTPAGGCAIDWRFIREARRR